MVAGDVAGVKHHNVAGLHLPKLARVEELGSRKGEPSLKLRMK